VSVFFSRAWVAVDVGGSIIWTVLQPAQQRLAVSARLDLLAGRRLGRRVLRQGLGRQRAAVWGSSNARAAGECPFVERLVVYIALKATISDSVP
jgi:hypothetical protein